MQVWEQLFFFFFFQAEDGIRDYKVTGVQTCALPIWPPSVGWWAERGMAVSISRAITRAVARPIGWVRSHVVERSMTPSWRPVTGSCTGAAQQTQLCTI